MNRQPVILYVEDEFFSRKVMTLMASHLKLPNVVIFEDSADFLARAERLDPRPDIVFLDIHVKPCSGFEMLQQLRGSRHFDGIPVLAMTASVMNEEIRQLRTAGFNGCLAKPVDIDNFPDALERILAGEEIWRIVE